MEIVASVCDDLDRAMPTWLDLLMLNKKGAHKADTPCDPVRLELSGNTETLPLLTV